MWERCKKAVKFFSSQIVIPGILWDWVKNIFLLIFNILGLKAWNILASGGNISPSDRILLRFCALVCTLNMIYLLIHFIKKLNSKAVVPNFPYLESNYVICKEEVELFFEDREHITYRRTVFYQVKDKSLKSISHPMTWTGDSNHRSQLDSESLQKGYRLTETKSNASRFIVTVTFPEAGYSGHYCFETKLTDTKHQMMPSLSRLIKCSTEKLSLKITAPPAIIQSCEQFVSADPTHNFILSGPESVKPERVGNSLVYRYNPKKLELLRYYKLQWIFEDPEAASTVVQNSNPS